MDHSAGGSTPADLHINCVAIMLRLNKAMNDHNQPAVLYLEAILLLCQERADQ